MIDIKKILLIPFLITHIILNAQINCDQCKCCNGCLVETIQFNDNLICNPNPWILEFEDNFNGNQIDDLSKWNVKESVIRGFSNPTAWMSPNNVEVSNGTLKLKATQNTPPLQGTYIDWSTNPPTTQTSSFNYSVGEIWTKQFFGYGKYEIRAKLPSGKGFLPSFWTFGGVGWNEIDVFEINTDKPTIFPTNFHRYPNTQSLGSYSCNDDWNGPNFSAAPHTFTMIWDFFKIEWYVDGNLVRRAYRYYDIGGVFIDCHNVSYGGIYDRKKAFPVENMNIILSQQVLSGDDAPNSNTTFPAIFEIEYVRYWRKEPLPVQTPPCLIPNDRKLANGFLINGKRDKVIEICLNDPIILSGVHPDPSCPQLISPNIYPKNKSIFGSCSDNDAFECNSNIISCICWFSSLFISVTLVNDNLTPVGPEFTKWQNFKSPDLVNINGINGEFYINPIDLRNYLPSPYINFQSGQTYKIKIANSDFNGWSEYTNYIHFYEDNRTLNGVNITSNIYGKNITISNSTVTQPIEVVASESIVILPNSTLNLGTYRIDEGLNCNSFMRVGVPDNTTYSKGTSSSSLYQYDKTFENTNENFKSTIGDKILIYPNPTSGNFTITQLEQFVGGNIEIINLMGQVVFSNIINTNQMIVDLSKNPKGIYLVKINSDREQVIEKIVLE